MVSLWYILPLATFGYSRTLFEIVNTTYMKISKSFWIALFIMTALFIAPTVITYQQPYTDGVRTYGFPFTFNSEGGLCPPPGCGHTFSYLNLALDIMILVAIPFIVNAIAMKMRCRN